MPDENVEEAKPKPAPTPKAEQPAAGAVVQASGGAGAVAAQAPPGIIVVQPRPAGPQLPPVSRRKVLQIGFWAALGTMLLGVVYTMLDIVYPSNVTGFGSAVFVGAVAALEPGKKLRNLDAKVWLVRFDAEQARRNPGAQEGSILALYHKCVHLGCTVPYRADFSREDPRNGETYAGWFLCPCHGSTYSDAGVRVFGPAPRSLDTFELIIKDGKMTVNTGKITAGNTENPTRAILPG
ncbi:MAG: Rieske 2Fe-2S domain-containing protein [Chloroflexota bacterium]|nr:Rieske 2Fe-2S domain-containing protein [Chloroflexota bacterium]